MYQIEITKNATRRQNECYRLVPEGEVEKDEFGLESRLALAAKAKRAPTTSPIAPGATAFWTFGGRAQAVRVGHEINVDEGELEYLRKTYGMEFVEVKKQGYVGESAAVERAHAEHDLTRRQLQDASTELHVLRGQAKVEKSQREAAEAVVENLKVDIRRIHKLLIEASEAIVVNKDARKDDLSEAVEVTSKLLGSTLKEFAAGNLRVIVGEKTEAE